MPIQEREPRSEVLTMLGDCLMSSPKVGKAQRKPVAGARKASARVRAGGVRPVLRAKAMKASSFLSKVGDPTRICIILAISDGGLSVASICSAIGQSVPGTSHHLALLRHQGVLQKAETGERLYSLITWKETGELVIQVVASEQRVSGESPQALRRGGTPQARCSDRQFICPDRSFTIGGSWQFP